MNPNENEMANTLARAAMARKPTLAEAAASPQLQLEDELDLIRRGIHWSPPPRHPEED